MAHPCKPGLGVRDDWPGGPSQAACKYRDQRIESVLLEPDLLPLAIYELELA
jgi:hypothetical protein